MPKTKIVKPQAVRRSLRARMTGSLDRTRHTDGKTTPAGAGRSRVECDLSRAQKCSMRLWWPPLWAILCKRAVASTTW